MDINRGNRFDYLVSMSADGTRGNRDADINTSLIRTVNGQTITLYYDTQAAPALRPDLSRAGHPGHLLGHAGQDLRRGPQPETRTPGSRWTITTSEFENPLWKAWGEKALERAGTAAPTGWRSTA